MAVFYGQSLMPFLAQSASEPDQRPVEIVLDVCASPILFVALPIHSIGNLREFPGISGKMRGAWHTHAE
jgi:hypothetical protein